MERMELEGLTVSTRWDSRKNALETWKYTYVYSTDIELYVRAKDALAEIVDFLDSNCNAVCERNTGEDNKAEISDLTLIANVNTGVWEFRVEIRSEYDMLPYNFPEEDYDY
jgi:hypothetical protein